MICMCEHHVDRHESVTTTPPTVIASYDYVSTPMRCLVDDCQCTEFLSKPIATWIKIARMAEHVRRVGDADAVVKQQGASWGAAVTMPERVDRHLELSEELQLCEMLGSRLLERAQEIENGVEPRRAKQLDRECAVCGVAVDAECVPMHDGERSRGGWSHPERLSTSKPTADDALMRRVVSWAFSEPMEDETGIPPPLTVAKLADAFRRMANEMRSQSARTMSMQRDAQQKAIRVDVVTRELQEERARNRGNAVGAARQSCQICNGTGVDSRVMPPRRCSCAAGSVVNMNTGRMSQDDSLVARVARAHEGVPSLRRGIPSPAPQPMTGAAVFARNMAESNRVESRRAELRADVDAMRRVQGDAATDEDRNRATRIMPVCGCTWGSPCDEHGPYW